VGDDLRAARLPASDIASRTDDTESSNLHPEQSSRLARAHRWLQEPGQGALANWAVLTFLAAGIALRLWILSSPLGDADSDEAITGLIAEGFLRGEFVALYWGANYAGTLESFLTAIAFVVTGGSSTFVLKAVPALLTLMGTVLLWRLARTLFGARLAAMPPVVFWLFPAGSVLILMKAQVVYASGVVFATGAALVAHELRERPRWWLFLLFGFIVGLTLWATPLGMAVMVPLGSP
jgi:hypothetical protein